MPFDVNKIIKESLVTEVNVAGQATNTGVPGWGNLAAGTVKKPDEGPGVIEQGRKYLERFGTKVHDVAHSDEAKTVKELAGKAGEASTGFAKKAVGFIGGLFKKQPPPETLGQKASRIGGEVAEGAGKAGKAALKYVQDNPGLAVGGALAAGALAALRRRNKPVNG